MKALRSFATAALAMLLPLAASAQSGALPNTPNAAGTAQPIVEVVAAGAQTTLDAMADRVRALESRFAVSVRWSSAAAIDVREIVAPRAAGPGVFARVWLDLSDPARAVLFIANAGRDRLLVRVVPASDGYGEVTRESLATIMESAIDALLAGGQIGVDRGAAASEIEAQTGTPIAAAAEPAEPVVAGTSESTRARATPNARRPDSRSRAWSIAAHYRADAVADGPALRHGVQLALSWTGRFDSAFGLLLAFTAHYFPAFAFGEVGRRIQEHGGGARLAIGATYPLAGRFSWQGALAAGVDLARVEPLIDATSGLVATEPFVVTTPIAGAFMSGSWHPAPWIAVTLGLGLDLALTSPHFAVQRRSTRTDAVTPWRGHPYAFAGIAVPFDLGSER